MAHQTLKNSYEHLVDRINRFPQGAPPSELLFKILKMLFSEREAELVSLMPIKPFSAEKAAAIWNMGLAEAQKTLDALADRGILVDILDEEGSVTYCLPPPMAGFFEFSMMRIREDIDQKLLAELFYQYLNVEEDFIRDLFTEGETQLGRVLVNEPALAEEYAVQVLDYERATEVIKNASHIGIGVCYCRHKMHHLDRACSAPMNICMSLNTTASSLTRHGIARAVETAECLELLHQAYEHNLVQFAENIQKQPNFICNCCGCCCEAMIAQRRFGRLHPVHTTNFIPDVDESACGGCGKCVTICPVEAMTLVSANDPHKPRMQKAKLNEDQCLGCGVCVRNCPNGAITLKPRPERVFTPIDSVHRVVVMAIERGKLQDLIFDNQVAKSHRALAAVLGVILRLPPVQQALARNQMKSRYLESFFSRSNNTVRRYLESI
ncbi:MAG TPA: 4Fe-4S binding protein [Candidatus Hydrogenedentes bacterium]|nr:4Fe-4S binding protein [Candidatus Hydrogenedentota bacterium]